MKNKQDVSGSDKEKALKEIITQKWISIFPNGNEGWAEFRRTDYPELLNIEENNSDGDVPEGKFIKRIKYPQSESFNPNRPMGDNQERKSGGMWQIQIMTMVNVYSQTTSDNQSLTKC